MRTLIHRGATAAALAVAALGAASFMGACASGDRPTRVDPERLAEQQRAFWSNLEDLCGNAFEGRVVVDTTENPDFTFRPIIMHVRTCEEGRILVPFHVADDRSRTWVFTQTGGGLRLKHDHRHEDGSEDEITQYGGDTRAPGEPTRQQFHADRFTAELIPAASTNVWTVEIVPGRTFAYELRREGTDRRFRAEFDLTMPVEAPPAPWGHG